VKRALVFGAMLAVGAAAACKNKEPAHDHSHAHPAGHDHHEEGHGHDEPIVGFTLWSERFELFGEHAAASVGEEVTFLLHLTVLDGFKPLEAGGVSIELEGPAGLRAEAHKAVRPGIYRLAVTPKHAGKFSGRVLVGGELSDSIRSPPCKNCLHCSVSLAS
jgi:hypothetical protein